MNITDFVSYDELNKTIKESGYKQWFIAEKLGLPKQVLSNISTGRRSIKTDTLAKLCAFFEVPPSKIVSFSGIDYGFNFYDKWDRMDWVPPENPTGEPTYQPLRDLLTPFCSYNERCKILNELYDRVVLQDDYIQIRKENSKKILESKGMDTSSFKNKGLSQVTRLKLRQDRPVSMSVIYAICSTLRCNIDFVMGYK